MEQSRGYSRTRYGSELGMSQSWVVGHSRRMLQGWCVGQRAEGCLALMCGASDHVPICHLVDTAGVGITQSQLRPQSQHQPQPSCDNTVTVRAGDCGCPGRGR